jgi:hypothetical protein
MRPATVLSILLTGSVILNVILWWKDDPESETCFATSGFKTPTAISSDDASRYYNEYVTSLIPPDTITGGVITRSALDEMLCLKDCNAIAYSLARDASGTVGGDNKGAFVILQGVNVEYDAESKLIKKVTGVGSSYYVTSHWCPPTCLVW